MSKLIAHVDFELEHHTLTAGPLQILPKQGFQATESAAIIFGVVCVAILGLWYGISKLPKPKKDFTLKQNVTLARLVAILVVLSTAAVSLDLWWHQAVGRDTFWVPPHDALYLLVLSAILSSLYGWYRTRSKVWKRVAITLLLIPIAAPFDQLWHTIFGTENLTRAVALIWAPPHLIVAFSAIFSQIFLLPILHEDQNADLKELLGILIFGNLTATGLYLALPVHPTEAFGQIAGFWGAGIMGMVLFAFPFIGRVWLGDRAGATKIMLMTNCMALFAYGSEQATQVIMLPHDRMPNWINILAIMTVGVWIDVSACNRLRLKGLISGVLGAGLLFGLARYFIDPSFFYGTDNVIIAMVAGAIGGWIGESIAMKMVSKYGFRSSSN